MDVMSRAYDLRVKFEGNKEKLEILDRLVGNYRATLTGTDNELTDRTNREISNRVGGSLDKDPVYRDSQDMAVLEGIENRNISAADHLAAAKESCPIYATTLEGRDGYPAISTNGLLDATVPLVLGVNGKSNGHNGHNGHRNGTHIPPGYGIALDGSVVRVQQLAETNQNFRERITGR